MAILSATFAVFGKSSQISIPRTFVRIGWNGPRTSLGASGLRSNVSRWLGPPSSQSRMHDFALPGDLPGAAPRRRDQSASDSPRADNAPTRSMSRRVTPSQRLGNGTGMRSPVVRSAESSRPTGQHTSGEQRLSHERYGPVGLEDSAHPTLMVRGEVARVQQRPGEVLQRLRTVRADQLPGPVL